MNSQRVVYNPHILHLLYVKTRYLFNTINRYYRQRIESGHGDGNAFAYIVDCCVLGNHHVDVIVRDLVLMMSRMANTPFPIQLALCHFEVYLFRAIQTFRTALEPLDMLFTTGYYVCETKLSSVVTRDTHTLSLQRVLREYIEEYYFRPSVEKSEQRIVLFFNLKSMMEKEVADNVIDKADSVFHIVYDQELSATLFYLYLMSELYCLNELDSARINPVVLLDTQVIKQRKLYQDAFTVETNVANGEFTLFQLTLVKAFHSLCVVYRDLVIDRLVYRSKSDTAVVVVPEKESSTESGFFSSLFYASESTTSTTSTTKRKVAIDRHINNEYTLSRPVTDTVSPVLLNQRDGTTRVLGNKNDLYQVHSSNTVLVPVTYLPLEENPLIYTLCMYRVAFDLKLAEAHTRCRTTLNTTNSIRNPCLLCAYGRREKEGNNKLKDFIQHCNSYDLENPCTHGDFVPQYTRLCEQIAQIHIDLLPSLTLRNFKTLISIFWLFEYMPITLKAETSYHNLFNIIDPITLLNDLSKTVTVTHLEKAMSQIILSCYKKLRIEYDATSINVIEREQSIAMASEIINLFSASVSMQINDIQRYERSLSTELTVDATQLFREVSTALKTIFLAHLNVLLQVIMERHDHVDFSI